MKRIYTPAQKTHQAIMQRKRRKENPDKYREINRVAQRKAIIRSRGLTIGEYENKLLAQHNLCAICEKENQNKRDWHIDHNHVTGEVRGLLCHHCNLLLGNAKENVLTLWRAIDYLEKYN